MIDTFDREHGKEGMGNQGDYLSAGISREKRPGESTTYPRMVGALVVALGLALASPLTAAETVSQKQVSRACDKFLMDFFIGEQREDLLKIERNGSDEYIIRRDNHPAELHAISKREELSEISQLLHVDTVGECVLQSPGGLYVRLPVGSRVNKAEVVKTGYIFAEIGIEFGAKGLNSAGKTFIASISTVYPTNRKKK